MTMTTTPITKTPKSRKVAVFGSSITPADKKWRRYEQDVRDYLEDTDPGCTVKHNENILGERSGTSRQLDAHVYRKTTGVDIDIAVECKRYTTKKIGIEYIEAFIGKVIDVGFDKGIFYSFGEVTAPAAARAKGARQPKIIIRRLPPNVPPKPWSDVLEEAGWLSGCPSPNCYDDIIWKSYPQEDGVDVDAGLCTSCGSNAVKCSDCGQILDFPFNDRECESCAAEYRLDNDQDNLWTGITREKHGIDYEAENRRDGSVSTS